MPHPRAKSVAVPADELVVAGLGMKSMRVWLCVVVFASVATATLGSPLQAAETSTSTTTTIVVSPSVSSQPFTWSQRVLTVGATLKASKLVSSKIKGTRSYRATGACSLRKGVLSIKRAGECRVSVSVTSKGKKKITRSSKLFMVQWKEYSAPQMKLTGTPEEQFSQVLAATEKVAAFPLSSRQWNQNLGRLNYSLASRGIRVRWDPNEEGRNIYQISMSGQSACFLWETVPGTLDKYLKPYSCAKIG